MVGVGDLVQRVEDGHTGRVFSDRTIERSGDAMRGLHHACGDEERGFFFVEPQNQGSGGFSGLCLKIDSYDLVI
jgi:hypothetical protein